MSCVTAQDIPHSFLPKASKAEELKAIGTLKAYAFITPRKGGKSHHIHRLVQLAMRNWLKIAGELTQWSCETLKQIERIFLFCEHESKDVCTMYFPHVQCILKFDHFPGDVGGLLGQVVFNVGGYFEYTGKYIEAEMMYQQALDLNKEALGDNHMSTLNSMNNLVNVLGQQGRYVEAKMLQRQSLGLKKEIIGNDHPETLGSTNNLAIALRE